MSAARRRDPAPMAMVCALLLVLAAALALAGPSHAQTGLASDDFNRCTMPGSAPWTLVDPVGDGSAEITGAGTADARLALAVPEGTSHNPGVTNGALRLLQPTPDTDFTAEVKFESTPTRKFQIQGLMVEQDPGNYLRFEFYSDGSRLRAYAAAITSGGLSAKGSTVITSASPLWLRVSRAGDTWTLAYSLDGTAFTTAASFSHDLTVTAVGPYAGNYSTGSAPAFTAVVDYFSHQAGAPANEDAGTPQGTAGLAVSADPGGAVTRSPEAPHACGSTVTLTATPDPGFRFESWSGDLAGTANPEAITLSGSTPASVEARFVAEDLGPTISDVGASPGDTTAAITWTTDVPADSRVEYGPTSAYGSGPVTSDTLTTQHEVALSGLDFGTTYHFRVTSVDADGIARSSADQTFTTTAPPEPTEPTEPLAGDDFNRCTAPGSGPWALTDPLGDGTARITGAGSTNARLELGVPAGTSHNPDATNLGLRLLQPAPATDFEVEVKFESVPTLRFQMQGLVFERGPNDYVRSEFYSDGRSLRVYAATVTDGVLTARANSKVRDAGTLWMRVARQGDTWTQSYSRDGSTWVTAAQFTHAIDIAAAGPYAGNFGAPAPAFTALVDYVENTAAPIANEDGAPAGEATLDVSVVGDGSVDRDPAGPYACGATVALTANPSSGAEFVGFSGALSGSESPQSLTLDGAKEVTATFASETPPPTISAVAANPTDTGATITWTTDRPATSRVDHGPTSAYEGTPVTDPALVTAHSLALTGLEPGTLYHFRVTSADADGLESQSEDMTFTTAPVAPGDASGIRSDDFNNPNLNTGVWTLGNPVGDGTIALQGTGTSDARLALTVPAGTSHNPAGDNRSVRVLQPSADTDLQVEAKFDSPLTAGFQMRGIMVEQSPQNWLRFEFYSDGSSVRAYVASISNGSLTNRANTVIAAADATHMRVTRSGNTWTQEYSPDGVAWTTNATFTQALTVSAVGPYAGNHGLGGGLPPAHTALVDHFENTAAPIAGEDQGTPVDSRPPLLHAIRAVASAESVRLDWATDEAATRSVRYGTTTGYELGTVTGDGTGVTHSVTVPGLAPATTHHFQIVSTDAGGRSSASADIAVTTGDGVGVPEIEIFGGDTLSFGQIGLAQRFVNVQGNVSDPDGVASLTYTLNGGAQRALSLGPDDRRLALPGDFNADILVSDAVDGANTVVLTATDTLGNVATRTVTVNVTKGTTWPLTYSIDWSAASRVEDVAQIVDGDWRLEPNGVRPTVIEYDRLLAVGDTSWQDYEVTVPVTVHAIDHANGDPLPSNGPAVGIFTRWQGHSPVDDTQPMWGFYPAGGYAFYRWRPDGTERFEMNAQGVPRDVSSKGFPIGTTMMFKFRVETQPDGHGLYRFRAWPVGTAEPTGWDLELTGASDLPTGSVLLIAHHADVTFGDLSVVPL